MARTFEDARAWAELGNELVLKAAAGMSDDDLRAPSSLPGWSVGNLVAHIAANGDALLNLVTWAKTGVETPMYASTTDRADGIAKGGAFSSADAQTWLSSSISALRDGFDSLTEDEWSNEVVTAQGRTVPATELPWMRSREGLIHAVDLGGVGFDDLPDGFLDALVEDICLKRGLSADALPQGSKADVAAWLAGRPSNLTDAPEIGAWL